MTEININCLPNEYIDNIRNNILSTYKNTNLIEEGGSHDIYIDTMSQENGDIFSLTFFIVCTGENVISLDKIAKCVSNKLRYQADFAKIQKVHIINFEYYGKSEYYPTIYNIPDTFIDLLED